MKENKHLDFWRGNSALVSSH